MLETKDAPMLAVVAAVLGTGCSTKGGCMKQWEDRPICSDDVTTKDCPDDVRGPPGVLIVDGGNVGRFTGPQLFHFRPEKTCASLGYTSACPPSFPAQLGGSHGPRCEPSP